MFRFLLLLISLVWASLLLISWGGPTTPQSPEQVAATATARS